MKTDIEIARDTALKPIEEVAQALGIDPERIERYGKHIAKLPLSLIGNGRKGKLILVTAITATRAGIGKTTVCIGLALGLHAIGKRTCVALREPSLGPCFGMKGGAAGGGYAQVLPMERINLHFTGDFHAVTAAHNMIAALLDNLLYHRRNEGFGLREILWRRVLDVNDRSLRSIVTGLGSDTDGITRQSGFDITPASELMAILCLAQDEDDLRRRIEHIILGYTYDGKPFTVRDLGAAGAAMALLKDAIQPNLVQTTGHTPAIIHGGPFANIAHGCSSLVGTRMALSHADYTITEAGFGADLGTEKFYNILCRKSGIVPDLTVIVATAQGLKMHGGTELDKIHRPDAEGLRRGLANLDRHVRNIQGFGQSVVVVLNRYKEDTDEETQLLRRHCEETLGVPFVCNTAYAEGAEGAKEMAALVADTIACNPSEKRLRFTYNTDDSIQTKIEKVAKTIYGARSVSFAPAALKRIRLAEEHHMANFPVCIAKTQFSFSADPKLYGAASGFDFLIRDVTVNAGAEMIVAIAGNITRMPGLPKDPQANRIDYINGEIVGLS